MSYAHLGQSCQTSMAVLIDNRKFLPLNDPVYDIFYTKMRQYPATHDNKSDVEKPKEKPQEEYSRCCGKK